MDDGTVPYVFVRTFLYNIECVSGQVVPYAYLIHLHLYGFSRLLFFKFEGSPDVFLQDKGTATCQITDKCNPGDVFQVPDEVNFFNAHYGNTGSRADNKDTSACSGAVGQHFPEIVVYWEVIHAHGTGH